MVASPEQFMEIRNTIKEMVAKIESNQIPTTKGHYGDYMAILSRFPQHKNLVAKLLLDCGANNYGVEWALKLVG
jgi:hypothetical protein